MTPELGTNNSALSGDRYCRHCGYDLRLIESCRCPECGRVFRADGVLDWVTACEWKVIIKRRRVRRVLLAFAVSTLTLAFAVMIRQSYRSESRTELCEVCGAARYIDLAIVAGITISETQGSTRKTVFTLFLPNPAGHHDHVWRTRGVTIRQVDGQISYESQPVPAGIVIALRYSFNLISALELRNHHPFLADWVRSDILIGHDNELIAVAVFSLTQMLDDPSATNCDRQLERWKSARQRASQRLQPWGINR